MSAANPGNDRANPAVGIPDIEAAEETRDDSGKTGVSAKKVAAGAVAAAAGVAAAAALKGKGDSHEDEDTTRVSDIDAVPAVPVADVDTPAGTTTDREGPSV